MSEKCHTHLVPLIKHCITYGLFVPYIVDIFTPTESIGILSSYMLLDPMVPLSYYLAGIVLKLNTQVQRLLHHIYLRNKHGC